MSLRSQFEVWVAAKAIISGMERLEAQHVGTKIRQAIEGKFGAKHSPDIETRLTHYLQTLINEIQAKPTP